jgi:hypothetical protein
MPTTIIATISSQRATAKGRARLSDRVRNRLDIEAELAMASAPSFVRALPDAQARLPQSAVQALQEPSRTLRNVTT